MKRLYASVAAVAIFIFLTQPAFAQTLLFDDFGGNGAANSNVWDSEFHVQGRGQFEGPGYRNGNGQLTLGVYSGDFRQQIIRSRQWFAPGNDTIVAEARIRIAHNQPGIVHGFFFYNQYYRDGRLKSDELDFEWLTSQMTGNSDPIHLTTWQAWDRWSPRYGIWNDPFHGTHQIHEAATGSQLNWRWRTYRMEWRSGQVDFFVDGSWVHGWSGAGVPSGGMRLFLNSWVPDASWAEAYSGGLRTGGSNWYSMEVDWVRVSRVAR